jgi:NAD(P)H-hydrate epimerase
MKLLSAAQMRALDAHVIGDLGVPGPTLMERAGRAVADAVADLLGAAPGPVVILCGKGNNGGDGLVAARLLHAAHRVVRVVLPFPPEALSPDARVMFDRAAGVPLSATIDDDALAAAAVVVDALLGTGVRGAAQGVIADLIDRTNRLRDGRGVLAVDLPSGVDTDTGQVAGPAMRAAHTLTLAAPKPALVLHPAAALVGAWRVADIGFPPDVLAAWPQAGEITEAAQAAAWLPPRPATAHKMGVGAALVIAGSYGMTGAAAMACTAAYRAGAGLVRLALPAPLVPALNAVLTEVVFRPLPSVAPGVLGHRAIAPLLDEAREVRAALIGPGLSRARVAALAIQRLVPALPCPLVVDADALTALAGDDAPWARRTHPTIITPHPGEMARLLNRPVAALEADRLATAREAAARFGAVTVFKGTPTVIAAPDGRTFVNPTGNPALAVAGTGDMLAGAITALLAQGAAPLHAAVLATYAGGRAADLLAAARGPRGLTVLDLIAALPDALAEMV